MERTQWNSSFGEAFNQKLWVLQDHPYPLPTEQFHLYMSYVSGCRIVLQTIFRIAYLDQGMVCLDWKWLFMKGSWLLDLWFMVQLSLPWLSLPFPICLLLHDQLLSWETHWRWVPAVQKLSFPISGSQSSRTRAQTAYITSSPLFESFL